MLRDLSRALLTRSWLRAGNSKLTHVLQKCLGSADAKILMSAQLLYSCPCPWALVRFQSLLLARRFINVSPNCTTLDETINSLRFASKVFTAQSGGGLQKTKSG